MGEWGKPMRVGLVLLSAVLLACGSLQRVEAADSHPSWITSHEWEQLSPDERIEGRVLELTGLVNSYLSVRGYRLGSGADYDFRDAIRRAAEDIEKLPESVQRARVDQANRAFKTLIDAMIIESREIAGYQDRNFRVIGEQTLMEALRKLCPLWPFCD